MTKRDRNQKPEPTVADLRGWGAKKLEDYELALRHVDGDVSRLLGESNPQC